MAGFSSALQTRETQRNYMRDVGRLTTFLQRPPDTATVGDLRRFPIAQQEVGLGVPTMNVIVSALRFFFGADEKRTVILLLDDAGWHTEPGLRLPEGLRLIYLPPYTPELQPAEHLWRLVDEPIVNQHVPRMADIQDRIGRRCRDLEADPNTPRDHTLFHRSPQQEKPG